MYKWLKFGRRVLLSVLQKHPQAMVIEPSALEVMEYQAAIEAKYPVLKGVWAACDGLKLPLQQSTNWGIQSYYYNSWQSSTFVNSVLLFAPDGMIKMCLINAPGTWHDAVMADFGVYDRMESVWDKYKAKIVVDSAFPLAAKPYLIKSSQEDPDGAGPITVNRAATSVRQLSEWGMRMIQGQFPRMKDKMGFEEFGERKVIQHLMILLYNYQTSRIGINTILNSYMRKLPKDIRKEFDGHYYDHFIDLTGNRQMNI
jgi:hypothetical protein